MAVTAPVIACVSWYSNKRQVESSHCLFSYTIVSRSFHRNTELIIFPVYKKIYIFLNYMRTARHLFNRCDVCSQKLGANITHNIIFMMLC